MPRPRVSDDKVYAAAFLRGEMGLSQTEIADRLTVSPATACRMLARGKQLGCLQEQHVHRFVRIASITDAMMAEMDGWREFATLADTLSKLPTATGLHLRRLRVFDSGSNDESSSAIEKRQRVLGATAARYVAERLRHASVIAVSWGSTLSRLIDGIRKGGYTWPDQPNRIVLPVAAEPVTYAHNSYTSSTLARRLDTMVNDESAERGSHGSAAREIEARRLALTGVPAFVPADLNGLVSVEGGLAKGEGPRIAAVLRSYVEQCSSAYQKIFRGVRGRPPLIKAVDALLTGAGDAVKPLGFCNGDLRKFGGNMTAESLEELVIGDVGGVLLPRPGSSDQARQRVAALNAMWTGLKEDHLVHIARRAQEVDLPEGRERAGVMLVCLGHRRAEVVHEAIKRGFCTELIIDQDLARTLADIVGCPSGSSRREASASRQPRGGTSVR
jgi:DNA-binding transcriptional regulator LsrR (DeoR family)